MIDQKKVVAYAQNNPQIAVATAAEKQVPND